MQKWLTRACWGLGAAAILALLVVILALALGNTGIGRDTVASLVGSLTGGRVTVVGLSGRFPDAPRAAHVEVRDDNGLWLSVDDVAVDWSPLAWLHNDISVENVRAGRVTLYRLPVRHTTTEEEGPHIDVEQLQVDRLTIGRALAGNDVGLRLSGKLHYVSKHELSGEIRAARLDAPGRYDVDARVGPELLSGSIIVNEPPHGFLAGIVGAPDLGPLALNVSASGPRRADNIRATIDAGPLHATAQGIADLTRETGAISFQAQAPAISPRPDLSWQSFAAKGELRGAFAKPDLTGRIAIEGLKAGGASVQQIVGDVRGVRGDIHMTGSATGWRVPAPNPDILGATPVMLEAHADLASPGQGVDFSLSHPLLALNGHVETTGGSTQATFALTLPKLGPLAAMEGVDATGSAALNASVDMRQALQTIALDGAIKLDAGASLPSRLLGRDSHISALLTAENGAINVRQVQLTSTAADAAASGSYRGGNLQLGWTLGLADVSRLMSTLNGRIAAQGRLEGRTDNLTLTADGTGTIATRGVRTEPLRIAVRAKGIPRSSSGTLDAHGMFDGAPLALAATLQQAAKGTFRIALDKADWKSLHIRGALTTPPSFSVPSGKMEVHVGRLADLQAVAGQPLAGKLDGAIAFAEGKSHLLLTAQGLGAGGAKIGNLKIAGDIASVLTKPVAALSYNAEAFSYEGVNGRANGTLVGDAGALNVTLASDFRAPNGEQVQLAAAATADIRARKLALTKLDARAAGQTARLLAAAHFDLANGAAVDALRIGSGRAELDVGGRFAPRLDATVNLRNATSDTIKPFVPTVAAQGTLSVAAKLAGTLAAPQGTIAVAGKGLRLNADVAGAMPPTDLVANAILHGASMTVRGTLDSGASLHLAVTGDAPMKPGGAINLHANGTTNLALLDPVLNARGVSLHGVVALDMQIGGTIAVPRATGAVRLTNGEFQDYLRGIRVSNIAAVANAEGDRIVVSQFSGRAGQGTITGNGSVDLKAAGMPVDISIVASNAQPISNDVLNAIVDANVKLSGRLKESLTLSGNVNVRRGEINIPDSLPPEVAVLNVRRRGAAPLPPATAAPEATVGLDLTVKVPGQLFVRGHGLDAEVNGKLHIGGSTNIPDVSGGFEMRRGNLSLAGQTLDFTSGRVTFAGASLRRQIDPALDFVAQSTSSSVTATLQIGGYASAPQIKLTSSPSLPQDEILSRLLFQQSMTQLSPWQVAQIAQALASLSGMGGGLGDPLARVRKSLGLDRLAVGSGGATGTETTVEAGRYVAHNVYVGARQGTGGSGTQAIVQVDLTKHLKLQTQISTNNSAAPASVPGTTPVDTGSNVGLSYQFEY